MDIDDIKKLSLDERVILRFMIDESIREECAEKEVSEEVKAELDKRLEAYERNEGLGVSWDELRSKLLSKHV